MKNLTQYNNLFSTLVDEQVSLFVTSADFCSEYINPYGAAISGYDNIESALGQNTTDFGNEEFTQCVLNHNNTIMRTMRTLIGLEFGENILGDPVNFICLKTPKIINNEVHGVIGIALEPKQHSTTNVLRYILHFCELVKIDFEPAALISLAKKLIEVRPIIATETATRIKNTQKGFTKRESECLVLLIKNVTVRDIANQLNISPRTTEHHIANIKHKLGIRRRGELFEAVVNLGLGDLVFSED